MRFCLESEPLDFWLAPFRVSIYPDDRVGLVPTEVKSILELMPAAKLIFVELAFDFLPLTITQGWIKAHGLFGKSRRDVSRADPYGNFWGTRRGRKSTASYFKPEVWAQRLEVRMRSAFLRGHGIDTIFDFHHYLALIPDHHVFFGRLAKDRLIERLRAKRYRAAAIVHILREVAKREDDLGSALGYLRRRVGLVNTRRLLRPLAANRLVREALRELLNRWPTTPHRLGEGK